MDKSNINQIIHHPNRLKILTYLSSETSANFTELKHITGLTDGNLGSHITKLSDEKLVIIKKTFSNNKPLTQVNITKKGKEELVEYIKTLKKMINKVAL